MTANMTYSPYFDDSYNNMTTANMTANIVPYKYEPTFTVVPPTWHKPTFVFAFFLLVILFLGLWFGRNN